jgi:hypothetical protein
MQDFVHLVGNHFVDRRHRGIDRFDGGAGDDFALENAPEQPLQVAGKLRHFGFADIKDLAEFALGALDHLLQ